MREILFRGKRVDNGEWVEGYYVLIGSCHRIYTGKIDINKSFENQYGLLIPEKINCLVDPETVCQHTGLTDKNGKKIWENDICDRKEKFPEIVTYHDGDWTLDYSYASGKEIGHSYCNLGFYAKERGGVEVIGNIFDNPELLGGDTD